VEIPYSELSGDALRAIIEEFVSREGTEYGAVEISLDTKVEQVRRQLEKGEVGIDFDPDSQTCHLFDKKV